MPSPVGLPSEEPLSEEPLSEVLPFVPAVSAALLLPHSLPPALPVLLHLLPPVPAHLPLPVHSDMPDMPAVLLPRYHKHSAHRPAVWLHPLLPAHPDMPDMPDPPESAHRSSAGRLQLLPPAHLLLPALPQAAPDKPDLLLPDPDRTGLPLPVQPPTDPDNPATADSAALLPLQTLQGNPAIPDPVLPAPRPKSQP